MNFEKIKAYLTENTEVAFDVARDLNSWNGSMEWADYFYFGDLVDCMCCDYDTTRKFLDDVIFAAKNGEFNDFSEDYHMVKYDDLGNLVVSSPADITAETLDNLGDIIDGLIENYPHNVDVYDEGLRELLDEEDEESEEESEEN